MKNLEDIKLTMQVSEMLLDIINLGEATDLSYGDLQSILEAKSMQIIKKVRGENG